MRLVIAHGGDVSNPSGGTDRVSALATGMHERGHEVTLVVPEPENDLPDRLDEVTVRTVSTDFLNHTNAVTRALSVTRAARSLVGNEGGILQLEHSTLAGMGTLHGCNDFVLDMHDVAYPRFDHVETPLAPVLKRGVKLLEGRALEKARHIVVVSEEMKRMLRERWNVEGGKVSVVPNGYFPDRIATAEGTRPVPGRVCFLGTLHPKVDIEAFARIADLGAVSEVVVVGDGAQRDRVESLADRHDEIQILGRLPNEEAFERVASASVVVNPQLQSALQSSSSPVKLFYYAALGKPMVVTEGPSVVDQLAAQNAAKTADDRDAFVHAVDTVLEVDSLRENLAENGRRMAAEFDWNSRSEELVNIYDREITYS